MTSWAPRDRLICPHYVHPRVIYLLQDHWFNTVRSILNWSFMSNFSLFKGVVHYGVAGNANLSLNIGDVTTAEY